MSVPDIFRRCGDVFRDRVYGSNSYSIMCSLHDSFGSLRDCSPNHNCLGCNFNDSANWVRSYLERYQQYQEVSETFAFYIMRLYLLVERYRVIFDVVSLPESTRQTRFKVFQSVHKWANFFKHPNAFILVHHAKYFFDGDPAFNRSEFSVVIDQDFVYENYSSEKCGKKIWDLLKNKKDVAVLFPNPVTLTEEFCDAMRRFLELIRDNEVYREMLATQSTYEGYFANPCG